MSPETFAALCARSRELHGHKYVLPVAVWIGESGNEIVTAGEALIGLGGQADRTRILEALMKMAAFDVLTELPRAGYNLPRYFQRNSHPYWDVVETYADDIRRARR